jgi:hypothetical protein
MERHLDEDEISRKLPLKIVGSAMDIEVVSVAVIHLRKLLEENPLEFNAFVSLVEGRKEHVTEANIEYLRNNLFLASDGTPLPILADVLRAAYRPNAPDGPCIVEPFDLKSAKDVSLVEKAEEEKEKRAQDPFLRLLREASRKKPDGNEERSR